MYIPTGATLESQIQAIQELRPIVRSMNLVMFSEFPAAWSSAIVVYISDRSGRIVHRAIGNDIRLLANTLGRQSQQVH